MQRIDIVRCKNAMLTAPGYRERVYLGCLREQLVFSLSVITTMDSPQRSPFSASQTVNYETFSNEPFRPPRTTLGGIIRGRLTQT